MKATLDENGTLTIAAESAVEAYALRRWTPAYFNELGLTEAYALEHGMGKTKPDVTLMIDANWPRLDKPAA